MFRNVPSSRLLPSLARAHARVRESVEGPHPSIAQALLFLIGLCLLACPSAQAAIAFVQVHNSSTNVNAGSFATTVTDTATTTSGDLVVAVCRQATYNVDGITISDSGGNTWTLVTSTSPCAACGLTKMYYSVLTTGDTNGTCTFPSYSASAVGRTLMVMEFSGAAASPADGSSATGSNAGATSLTSANLTTTNANDVLIFGAGVGADQTAAYGAG